MGACGAVWGETAGHPTLTHITSYLTIPRREGGGEKGGEEKKKEREMEDEEEVGSLRSLNECQ